MLKAWIACLLAPWLAAAATVQPAHSASPSPTDDPQCCGACHHRIYKSCSSSVMGTDPKNPIVYQFFTAANSKGEKDCVGFQGVFPGQPGDCAQCHVPTLVLKGQQAGRTRGRPGPGHP